MQIWRIQTRSQTLTREPVPDAWGQLGGRGLLTRILLDETDPSGDPLGRASKLVFAPGLLVGHMLSSCDRLSVGGKSPLTGGIKESNAGGSTGLHLTNLGIKALILEDTPDGEGWWVLHLSLAGARFVPAGDLLGLGVYETAVRLRDRFGQKAAISLVGPGGERRYKVAGIQNLDKDGVPSRINARGGMGAVLGSKRIKAIVVDDHGGEKPPLADPVAFKLAQKAYTRALLEHPQTAIYRDFGTAGIARMCNALGALPVRNFSRGSYRHIDEISGENLRETLLARGGSANPTHACMAGCTIRCSNNYAGPDGQQIVSPLEYETIGLLGSNLEISDLDAVARLNWEINDLGLDSIDIGAALGVAAEAGLMPFGDADRAMHLIQEIRAGSQIGTILGNGAAYAGRMLGVERVPVVKNQAISAYDPRAIKGTGVTYATNPQGADHTAGLTIRAKVDHLDPKGQADISRTAQVNMAGYDTLGACIFAGFGFAASPESIRDLLNARYGWSVGTDILQVLGRKTLEMELEYNRLAGLTSADNRLPGWMTREPLQPTGAVFDVPDTDLDGVFNW